MNEFDIFSEECGEQLKAELDKKSATVADFSKGCIEGRTLRAEFEGADAFFGSISQVVEKKRRLAKLHKEKPETRCKDCIIKGGCILGEAVEQEAQLW